MFNPLEAEQSDEQLYQEISKVWLLQLKLNSLFMVLITTPSI